MHYVRMSYSLLILRHLNNQLLNFLYVLYVYLLSHFLTQVLLSMCDQGQMHVMHVTTALNLWCVGRSIFFKF